MVSTVAIAVFSMYFEKVMMGQQWPAHAPHFHSDISLHKANITPLSPTVDIRPLLKTNVWI